MNATNRMSWGAYVPVRGVRTDALSGPVDVHRRNTARDRPVGGHAKRAIDIALAAGALGLLAPMLLLIAALLHVGLGRRIFVAQQRIGFRGAAFHGLLVPHLTERWSRWLAVRLRARPPASTGQHSARRYELRGAAPRRGRLRGPLSSGLFRGEARLVRYTSA